MFEVRPLTWYAHHTGGCRSLERRCVPDQDCAKHLRQRVAGKSVLGTQLVGTTHAPENFALKNNGTTPLTINRIYVMGANASDFTQTNTCGNAIAAGAKCSGFVLAFGFESETGCIGYQ
jgi:hypothetical protein